MLLRYILRRLLSITYLLPRGTTHLGWLWFPIEKLEVGDSRVLETVLDIVVFSTTERGIRPKVLEVILFDPWLSVSTIQPRRRLASTGMSLHEAALLALWRTSAVVPGC